MFTRAIVRPPVPNFAEGLTTADLGTPNYERALRQHEDYCFALVSVFVLIGIVVLSHQPL